MYALNHVGIRVSDLKRSLRFYVDALGGAKGDEYHMPSGSHIVFVNFSDFAVELICKPGDDRTAGRNHLALTVPDIHAAAQRLRECHFDAPPSSIRPMGAAGLNCFVTGPDDEIIELCEGRL